MTKRHMVIDRHTGAMWVQARDGQKYSLEELREIERLAGEGDAAAIATLETLDVAGQTSMDAMHDCPECRAALARGEVPTFVDGADFGAPPRTRGRMRPVMRRRPYRRHR